MIVFAAIQFIDIFHEVCHTVSFEYGCGILRHQSIKIEILPVLHRIQPQEGIHAKTGT